MHIKCYNIKTCDIVTLAKKTVLQSGRHMTVHCCPFLLPLLNTALHCFFASFSCTLLALLLLAFLSFSFLLFLNSVFLFHYSIIAIHSSAVACWAPADLITPFLLWSICPFLFLDGTLPTMLRIQMCHYIKSNKGPLQLTIFYPKSFNLCKDWLVMSFVLFIFKQWECSWVLNERRRE